jgi:23S rRNA-/tRNA-specific pseudouridylate synthase
LKKFYRAVCYITDEWKKFLDQIKTFPYYIKELVIAKVPHNEPKIWITKIMAISSPVGSSTAYRVPRTEKIWWLVELTLEILTWRTHQIRYHLSHHGLPIVGDYVYGKDPDVSGPMWLTAWKLIFQDLDGKMVELQLLPN